MNMIHTDESATNRATPQIRHCLMSLAAWIKQHARERCLRYPVSLLPRDRQEGKQKNVITQYRRYNCLRIYPTNPIARWPKGRLRTRKPTVYDRTVANFAVIRFDCLWSVFDIDYSLGK